MLHIIHNPNELLTRITNKISIEPPQNGPFSRSPSPTRKNNIDAPQQYHHHMRPHITPSDKSRAPKLVSLQDSLQKSKEMKDVAFEVTVDMDDNHQNLHPLDEPFILRNGKPIYPSDASPTRLNTNKKDLSNNIKTEDMIALAISLWKLTHSLLLAFWNIDLYFNITISENSTMKVHIPTLISSLLILKVFFSITRSGQQETFSVLASNSSSSSPSSPSTSYILPMLILISGAAYWYNFHCPSSTDSPSTASSSGSISGSVTLTDISSKAAVIPDIESASFSDSDTLVGSTKSQPMTIWEDEKPNYGHYDSNTVKLETILNRNKVPIEKEFHPLHRQEQKKRHPKNRLNLNLPLDNNDRRIDDPDCGFQEMTKLRRQEMLKAFNA